MSEITLNEEEVKQACIEFAKNRLEVLTPIKWYSWRTTEDSYKTHDAILEVTLVQVSSPKGEEKCDGEVI